jgi:hypothetical protein
MVFMVLLALSGLSLAQTPDLRQAPPPVAFGQWRPVDADNRTQEFAAEFPSAFETGIPTNDTVPVQAFLPARRTGPVPVVLILHYWGAIDLRVERNIAYALNMRGVAAVLIALPYHLGRTPPGSRSGAMAIEPDPEKLIRTMRQSVLDVRRAIDWIVSHPEFDTTRIGLTGTSLGSIVAATVWGVDSRLAAGAFVLGGVDLAHLLWRSSRVVLERDQLRAKGYTEEKLREALSPIEPGNYLGRGDTRPSFVVGAKFDTVIPPRSTELLVEALGKPAVLWLDTGHYGGFFVQKRVHSEVADFFDKTFQGETYVAPGRISAPTLRIGVSLGPDSGIQVAAGIDIWRGDAGGDYFANIQLAPRGPQLFAGKRLDRGLAVGILARSGNVLPGLFWSTVL